MTQPKNLFLQLHTLSSYPGALLNRDDAGFAKRLPFGSATRTRVSSQCLKRHWRRHTGEFSLSALASEFDSAEMAVRSRRTFEVFIQRPLVEAGAKGSVALAATELLMTELLGESAKSKQKKQEAAEAGETASARTNQITVLGRPEIDFLLAEAKKLAAVLEQPLAEADELDGKKKDKAVADCLKSVRKEHFDKEWSKNLHGLKRAAGLDGAMFGRMVTSDKLSRSDAAVHVAHAFTVHPEQSESDYFSAMDDLLGTTEEDGESSELGSGHINSVELTSGLYYGYVVVDVAQLVSNLEGVDAADWRSADRNLAAKVTNCLVNTIARVSPGAKLGSTAPYSFAHLVMLEVGNSQPRTLANAFLKPVAQRGDLLANTYDQLSKYVQDVDAMYELNLARTLAASDATSALEQLGQLTTVPNVAKRAGAAILEA